MVKLQPANISEKSFKLRIKPLLIALSLGLCLIGQPMVASAATAPAKPVIVSITSPTNSTAVVTYKTDVQNAAGVKALEYSLDSKIWVKAKKSPLTLSKLTPGKSLVFTLRQTSKTKVVLKVAKKFTVPKVIVVPEPPIVAPTVTGHTIGKLLWSDEFRGTKASAIDSKAWTARFCSRADDNGGGTCYNKEDQYYLPSAVARDGSVDGNAVITTTHITTPPAEGKCFGATCAFTSGRFDTQDKVAFKYGYIEARIKMPVGSGNWSAFWMLGANVDMVGWPVAGSISIADQKGNDPLRNGVGVNYSVTDSGCCSNAHSLGADYFGETNYSSAYHTYSIAWLPEGIEFFVDGLLIDSVTKEEAETDFWPFDKPAFLIFNNAVGPQDGSTGLGGVWDGWAKSTMSIDYVRSFVLDGKGEVTKK